VGLGPDRQFQREAIKEAFGGQGALTIIRINDTGLKDEGLGFELNPATRLNQNRFAFGSQHGARVFIVKGMGAHQDFGHCGDVVFVKQPDFKSGDLLGIANTNALGDANTALTQEFTSGRVDAEGVVIQIIANHVGGHKLGNWRLMTLGNKIGLNSTAGGFLSLLYNAGARG